MLIGHKPYWNYEYDDPLPKRLCVYGGYTVQVAIQGYESSSIIWAYLDNFLFYLDPTCNKYSDLIGWTRVSVPHKKTL